MTDRTADISRKTAETDIALRLDLAGGEININTGVGFFDHMLRSFAFHSGIGLTVTAVGDLEVDAHHTVEDVGIVLGRALSEALGDRRGIARFASTHVPMDEALAFSALDISGRPYLVFDAAFHNAMIGGYETCLTVEFMRAFAYNAGITLHLRLMYGDNDHHATEALFKSLARSVRDAIKITGDAVPSTKNVL